MNAVSALEAELAHLVGRPLSVEAHTRLREDLGLDSLGLIRLAVWAHERFGVNMGRLAEETGRQFLTVQDVLDVLPA